MKIQPHLTILVLLLCFVLQTSHARVIHDTDTTKRLKFLIIPTFFVTPEVGLAYGVSGSFAFKTSFNKDSLTRTSIIQGIGFLVFFKYLHFIINFVHLFDINLGFTLTFISCKII